MAQGDTPSRNLTIPPLGMGLRINLSIMMFLQFAIWGAWFVVFIPYLKNFGFSDGQAATVFGNMALGAILSTMFAGYIADRFIASEKMMAILHIVGAGLLYWMSQITSPDQYYLLLVVSLLYAVLYNPTLALSNSIAFTHIPDATRDFPGVRVLGTLGWIAVGLLIDLLFTNRATGMTVMTTNGPLLLAAGLSLALGLYSFFLPHTPPTGNTGKVEEGIPFLKALSLFKNFSFAVFFIVSFIITIVLAFYYAYTSNYLGNAIHIENIGTMMGIGQWAELILLPLLPFFLWRMGMKWVLALGMLCWGIRYAMFAFGGSEGFPFVLVILGIALHGICFDFFFAAGFIHVDNEAPRDIRASGQALFSFLTYGVGMWLGSLLAGRVAEMYTTDGVIDWRGFWIVPSIGVLVSLAIFVLFFRGSSQEKGIGNLPPGGQSPSTDLSTGPGGDGIQREGPTDQAVRSEETSVTG